MPRRLLFFLACFPCFANPPFLHCPVQLHLMRELSAWRYQGQVRAQKVFIPNGTETPRQLTFLIPRADEAELTRYGKGLVPQTVAFGYVAGWFQGEGRPPFHAYVRVGDRIFHFMEDGVIYETSFTETQRELLNRAPEPIPDGLSPIAKKRLERGNRPTTFEMVFALPPAARDDLIRYYRDRRERRATIGGLTRNPPYEVGGFGQMGADGVPVENCVTFALSFTQSHWSRDYPGLRLVRQAANFDEMPDGGILNGTTIPQFVMTAKTFAVVVFGKDAWAPEYRSEIDMLEQLRVLRRYKLKPDDIRTEALSLLD